MKPPKDRLGSVGNRLKQKTKNKEETEDSKEEKTEKNKTTKENTKENKKKEKNEEFREKSFYIKKTNKWNFEDLENSIKRRSNKKILKRDIQNKAIEYILENEQEFKKEFK